MARKGKGPAAAAPAEAESSETNDKEAPDFTESSADSSTNDTTEAAEATEKPVEEEKKDAPVENGKGDESTDDESKKKKKKIKKSIPEWATLSDSAKKSLPKSQMAKPKVQDSIIAAINAHGGTASAGSIKSFVMANNPDLPKMVLKKGVLKAIERGLIKQVKGKGFSGSFKLETAKKAAKAKGKDAKSKSKAAPKDKLPLESVFPSVFTWATNPKEASVGLIRKYIGKHYPDLDVDGLAFKKAIEGAEKKGQLRRLTGKGFSGTFELVDGADKTGAKYEDAIENAIISMNEPKQISVTGLRDYLSCWHAEYNTDSRPLILKKALDRCSERGWLQQISGKGFSGTYRLMYPYYPSPRELWGEYFEGDKKKDEKKESPKKAAKRSAPVEDSEDEEEDDISDEEPEYVPRKGPRGAPKARSAVVAKPKKKVAAKKPQKKTQKPTGKKTKAKKQKKK